MISQERMEQALVYLAETDELYARLKSDYERAKWKAKAAFEAIFLRTTHENGVKLTIAERQAVATNAPEYQEIMDHSFALLLQCEHVRNKRATEEIVFEAWRSLNKNR